MGEFAIITDSCSDLGREKREQFNIDYVRMHITYEDKDIFASLDWDLYSPKQLYDLMKKGIRVRTTQVPVEEFYTNFEKHLENKEDIVYIACSSALSGSFNTSLIVKDDLLKKYPERKIYCIDSLNSSLGEGSMAIDAANMRNEGKTIDEIVSCIEDNKLNYNQFATVADLNYLKRAGRVKASAAFFGNIFGVKPIIISDRIGQNYAIKKVKGRRTSLLELVAMAKEVIINPESQEIYIVHADCEIDAEFLKEQIEKEIHPKSIYINYMGPIIGASCGPESMGLFVKGKKVEIVGEN